MDRQQAIARASYLRCDARVIDTSTGSEKEYQGTIIDSTPKKEAIALKGGAAYKRHEKEGPSISAAKRFTRGKTKVVAVSKEELKIWCSKYLIEQERQRLQALKDKQAEEKRKAELESIIEAAKEVGDA